MGVFARVVLSSESIVDLNDIVSVCAVVEARVYRETLEKVLGVLREAVEKGVALDTVARLLEEWLLKAEEREALLLEETDPVYQGIVGKLREHSRELTQVSPESRHPAQSVD